MFEGIKTMDSYIQKNPNVYSDKEDVWIREAFEGCEKKKPSMLFIVKVWEEYNKVFPNKKRSAEDLWKHFRKMCPNRESFQRTEERTGHCRNGGKSCGVRMKQYRGEM
jgi:hypothetical protein